ncbi:MAG: LD-carboxypeptidase [Erysipelotrichaceae bacterium]|nr:LD-carboxypeptidase [Erysipelotrichaceae bacterium]
MIYPEFIKKGEYAGVCALSAGVDPSDERFQLSLDILRYHGINIAETDSVYTGEARSAEAEQRVAELHELFTDDDVKMVMMAAGGDFQMETLPYIDFDLIREHPKWVMGHSDPTNLLYPLTTLCDIATMYGYNAGSFDEEESIHPLTKNAISFLFGNMHTNHSSRKYEHLDYYNKGDPIYNKRTKWYGSFTGQGRMIGGCLDAIRNLFGTPYDGGKQFCEKYKDDGIIWYFDVYSLNSFDLYMTLLQMRYMGYFDHCVCVLFGRTLFPSEANGMSYDEAIGRALGDIPVIQQCDIGHTTPRMMMINGAMADVRVRFGKGRITYDLR